MHASDADIDEGDTQPELHTDGADDDLDALARRRLRLGGVFQGGSHEEPRQCSFFDDGCDWLGPSRSVRTDSSGGGGLLDWAEHGLDAPEGEGWRVGLQAGGQETRAEFSCSDGAFTHDPEFPCPPVAHADTKVSQHGGQVLAGYEWGHLGARGGLLWAMRPRWDERLTPPTEPAVSPAIDLSARFSRVRLRLGYGLACPSCVGTPSLQGGFEVHWARIDLALRLGPEALTADLRWRAFGNLGFLVGAHAAGWDTVSYVGGLLDI